MKKRSLSFLALLSVVIFLLVVVFINIPENSPENIIQKNQNKVSVTEYKKENNKVKKETVGKRSRKIAPKVDTVKENRDKLYNELVDIDGDLVHITMKCGDEVDEKLKFLAQGGYYNYEDKFYKDYNNVHEKLQELLALLDNHFSLITKKNEQLDLLIKSSSHLFTDREFSYVEHIMNRQKFPCLSENLDYFIDGLIFSNEANRRTEYEMKVLQGDILSLLGLYFGDIKNHGNLNSGMRLLSFTIEARVIEPTYKENLDIFREMLLDRSSELSAELNAFPEPTEIASYLQDEYRWREEIMEDVIDYVGQSTFRP